MKYKENIKLPHFYRLIVPLWIDCQGERHKVIQWNKNGLKIISDRGGFQDGDKLTVTINLKFNRFDFSIQQRVIVTKDEDHPGYIHFKFIELTESQRDVLTSFTQVLITGEMAVMDDINRTFPEHRSATYA